MTTATITWVDARNRHPRDGEAVLGATTGRYPVDGDGVPSPDEDFWLVLPMHFRRVHPVDGVGGIIRDCYRDSDGVIRMPLGVGAEDDEVVTHWASMPALPGAATSMIVGASVAVVVAAATTPTG